MRGSVLLTTVVIVGLFAGCLKTVARIDSNPSGAQVYFDSHLVPGKTPVEFEVDWYGPHTVTLVREGYPPSKHVVDVKTPKHLGIPLDLFVTLLPFPVTDRHEYRFDLGETQAEKK